MSPESKKRILISDDDRGFTQTLRAFLAGPEYEITVTYDGTDASNMLHKCKYDAIIFDCNIPGLDGLELSKVIVKTNAQARKIMVSGYAGMTKQLGQTLPIDDYFEKPVSLGELRAILDQHVLGRS